MGKLSGLNEGDAMTADVSDERAEAGDEDTGVVVAMEVVDGDEEVDEEDGADTDAEETVAKRPPAVTAAAAAAEEEEEEEEDEEKDTLT